MSGEGLKVGNTRSFTTLIQLCHHRPCVRTLVMHERRYTDACTYTGARSSGIGSSVVAESGRPVLNAERGGIALARRTG